MDSLIKPSEAAQELQLEIAERREAATGWMA